MSSIRRSRGGPNRIFKPNIAAAKAVVTAADDAATTSHVKQEKQQHSNHRHHAKHNHRDRPHHHQRETIQSHSIFEEGPAPKLSRPRAGDREERGGSSSRNNISQSHNVKLETNNETNCGEYDDESPYAEINKLILAEPFVVPDDDDSSRESSSSSSLDPIKREASPVKLEPATMSEISEDKRQSMFLLQVPRFLPFEENLETGKQNEHSQVGHLEVHDNGFTCLVMGENRFILEGATSSDLLEKVVKLKKLESSNLLVDLGEVPHKFTLIPDYDDS